MKKSRTSQVGWCGIMGSNTSIYELQRNMMIGSRQHSYLGGHILQWVEHGSRNLLATNGGITWFKSLAKDSQLDSIWVKQVSIVLGPNNIIAKHGIWTQENGKDSGWGARSRRWGYNVGECSRLWGGRNTIGLGLDFTPHILNFNMLVRVGYVGRTVLCREIIRNLL